MKLNDQKPEPSLIPDDGTFLDVHSKWNTIQGEGPFAGDPASFIRLAGCNLQCPLCDTLYTTGRQIESVHQVTEWVREQPHSLVVITGGEPFRQNLNPLIRELSSLTFRKETRIQIETNGTLYNPFCHELATVVCSPKTPAIHPAMAQIVKAWKYVLRHDAIDPVDGLPTSALGMKKPPSRPTNKARVYVQPCDDKDEEINRLNTQAAVDSAMKFGYTLCLQMQKIIGLA